MKKFIYSTYPIIWILSCLLIPASFIVYVKPFQWWFILFSLFGMSLSSIGFFLGLLTRHFYLEIKENEKR